MCVKCEVRECSKELREIQGKSESSMWHPSQGKTGEWLINLFICGRFWYCLTCAVYCLQHWRRLLNWISVGDRHSVLTAFTTWAWLFSKTIAPSLAFEIGQNRGSAQQLFWAESCIHFYSPVYERLIAILPMRASSWPSGMAKPTFFLSKQKRVAVPWFRKFSNSVFVWLRFYHFCFFAKVLWI